MRNHLCRLWRVVVFCLLATGSTNAQQLQSAPLNPEFVAFTEAVKTQKPVVQTTAGYRLGYRPGPVDISHSIGALPAASGRESVTYSATYDLRAMGKLTPVKDQYPYGACWAFATYGSLESCLLPGETRDFSENHLVNRHGFDWDFDNGGNVWLSMAYLTRWDGPINESDDPYPNPGGSATNKPRQKHVQQVMMIPPKSGPTANDSIKQAVMDYGAVYVNYYHDDAYYNSTSYTYYYNGSSVPNHAVTIVGWDDNFDRNKFSALPTGNGAYIVRNSWGSSWGDHGYYYVSYYDTTFAHRELAVFVNAEPTNNYDNLYYYDPLGWVRDFGGPSATLWGANLFTATLNHSLQAVGFFVNTPNTVYEIYVYTGVTAGQPRSGTLAATKTGTSTYFGYRTISLDAPVPLAAGQRFSIVLKMTTPGYNFPQPFEYATNGFSSRATAAPGQSFYSSSGSSWTDLTTYETTANFCIRGYGKGASAPTRIISVSGNLAFGNVTIGQTATATMTIANSGNSALTVTGVGYPAGFSGAWSGSIGPGKSTNVTVRFTPTLAQSYGGAVTVNSDKTSGANTLNASGTGIQAPTRIISVSGNLAFGNVTIGQTATATMTIANSGNSALTVTGVGYPAGFSGAWSGSIGPGKSTNVTVRFTPTLAQSYSGAVTVNSDKTSGANTLNASGTGIQAPTRIISVSGNLAFGNVTIGQTATATMTIANSGNSALTVTGIGYPAGFSGAWSGSIGPGKSTNVTVRFTPTLAQSYSGAVTVNSDKTSGANTLNASGTGIPGGTLQLKSSTYLVTENGGSVRVYVSRTGGVGGAVSVHYATFNETAVAGSDYTAISGTLNWPAGDMADKYFDVLMINDSATEGYERFKVTLSGASGISLGSPSSATVSIRDDEKPMYTVNNDFDGDGQSDIGVFRPSTVTWYIFQSSAGSMNPFQYGTYGDIPVPADYDGDGKTDIAIFRPSNATWSIFGSKVGSMTPINYGSTTDIPIPADYDGDGKADLAVFRPSNATWYIFGSKVGAMTPINYGSTTDLPIPEDYDGDGKADLAVFRPSNATWYIFGSKVGAMTPINYGSTTDLPIPGDYDADGKTDIAVFRPSNVTWYIFGSKVGAMTPFQFGAYGDTPFRW